MSLITLSYNFTSHDEAIAFLTRNGNPANAASSASDAPAPAPVATPRKPKPAATEKSFGPVVEGDPEGTRYFFNSQSGNLTKAPKDNVAIAATAGNTEISGAEYLQKKSELAAKAVAAQKAAAPAPAASPAPAPAADAEGLSGGDTDEFDPFAEPPAAGPSEVSEAEVMDKVRALTKVENGRDKLLQVLQKFGDGKSVPLMLKGADNAKRVAIFMMADELSK